MNLTKNLTKKLVLFILSLALVAGLASCNDNSGGNKSELEDSQFLRSESNENYLYDVYEDYSIITAYIGEDFTVKIPSKLGGKKVKAIGENAIGSSMLGIDIVEIPKSIVYIDPSAFADCTTLAIYTVASGNPVYKSEKGIMYSKDGKTLLHYPPGKKEKTVSVANEVEAVGGYAFSNCEDIEKITLPQTIKTIGSHAFQGCDKLIEVNIPQGVEVIEDYAFYECRSMAKLDLPQALLKIGDHAFDYCISIKEAKIPDSVTQIGEGAFMRCESLKDVTLPAGLNKYGYKVFAGCRLFEEFKIAAGNEKFRVSQGILYSYDGSELIDYPYGKYERKIEIADGVKTIRAYSFYRDFDGYEDENDDNIQAINFGKAEKVGAYAFANRNALSVIELPKTLKSLSSTAFNNCTKITEYKIPSNEKYISIDGVLFTADKKTLIAYPCGSSALSYTIPQGTEIIGDYAFSYSMTLTQLDFAASIRVVGDYSFYHASRFSNTVEFSDKLESIGKYCFSGAMSVEKFVIPDNTIKSIPENAFEGIDGVFEFIIPSGVIEIGKNAFRETAYIVYIEIPDTVTKIDDRAFYDLDSLHEITIPEGVTDIGEEIVSIFDESDPDKATLKVVSGSVAEQYAIDSKTPYEVI